MNIYSLYWDDPIDGKPKWAMLTNEPWALKHGERVRALVMKLTLPACDARGPWDAPTLRAISEPIADFRPPQT